MSNRYLDSRANDCHRKVRAAIKAGLLVRPEECSRCHKIPKLRTDGASGIQGHHNDYSKPLVVEWLCSKCHREDTPLPEIMGAPTFGSRNGQAKLREEDIENIRTGKLSCAKTASLYGVSKTTIKDVRSGRYWKQVDARPQGVKG